MKRQPIPTDRYPTRPLSAIQGGPIGVANYQEPIFRRGTFQNQYIEVEVRLYPTSYKDPQTNKTLIGVQFGQMAVVRFIDRDLLYNIRHKHR